MTRRHTYLVAIMVMGAIVTTVGGTGIFAAFTDRATQGDNNIQSGSRPSAADIDIAEGTLVGTAVQCGPFGDNLSTALWSVVDMQPGDYAERYLCVKNAGSAPFYGSMSVIDLVNDDVACTGDEAIADATCGTGPGHGQLSSVLDVGIAMADCDDVDPHGVTHATLDGMAAAPLQLGDPSDPLEPAVIGCLQIAMSYPVTTAQSSIQAAQTDGVHWKFAFDVTATE